jgi:molecular chaperone GrpE
MLVIGHRSSDGVYKSHFSFIMRFATRNMNIQPHNNEEDEVITDSLDEEAEENLELEEEEVLSRDRLKKIRFELTACHKEKQEYLDGWQRARADFLNLKRRSEDDGVKFREQAVVRHVETLLPVLDSFALATASTEWEQADPKFKAGFTLIQSQLDAILKEYGVTKLSPHGALFDPTFHDAISEEAVEDTVDDGMVRRVVQPGYTLKETVIRPARVIVGRRVTETP